MQKMKIQKAIEILEIHNKWRRDNDGKYKMAEPKELGIAIDTVVSEFKNLHLQNVSKQSELLKNFLDWGDGKWFTGTPRNEDYEKLLDEFFNCG